MTKSIYLTSYVIGLKKRYIPIFSYPHKNMKKIEEQIKKTQNKFKLTDVYFFRTFDDFKKDVKIIGICLKTLDKNRIKKILKYAKSKNLTELTKYGKNRIRMTDEEGNMMEYIKTLESNLTIPFISYGHYNLISAFIDIKKYLNMHGDSFELSYCEFKNGN